MGARRGSRRIVKLNDPRVDGSRRGESGASPGARPLHRYSPFGVVSR